MVAQLLRHAGIPCSAFLGGISKNFNSNLLVGQVHEGKHIVVVEADEYDRSFLTLHPDVAVITSMDADHLDIYGSSDEMKSTYRRFAAQVKPGGVLFLKKGLSLDEVPAAVEEYSVEGPAGICAPHVIIKDHQYRFDWTDGKQTWRNLATQLPGLHNVENAVAAIAVAKQLGLTEEQIRQGLESYTGVKRRFDYQVRGSQCVFIDDYAHHPEELRACIQSARDLYPGRHLTGIFQPHLYSRTRDFAAGFAHSLSLLDRLLLLDIYPARELPIPGVSSSMILDMVTIQDKRLVSKEEVLSFLSTHPTDVLLTLGAGDIDQLVAPIRQLLQPAH
jgi:UDP-N-acetylmuramate--alanine ligase